MRKGDGLMVALVLGGLYLWATVSDGDEAEERAELDKLTPQQRASVEQRAAASGQTAYAVLQKDKRRAM